MRQIVFVLAALLVTALLILLMTALIRFNPPPVVRRAEPVERIAIAPVEQDEPARPVDAPPRLVSPPDPGATLRIPAGRPMVEPRRAELRPFELASHGAIPLSTIEPVYPTQALEGEIAGRVRVEFTITPDGTVSDAAVVEAEPRRGLFESAALRALYRARFIPKTLNGTAVPSRAEWTFHFTIASNAEEAN